MPLFSPSLHGIQAASVIAAPGAIVDKLVFYDATTRRGARQNLADRSQEECFIFSMNGLTTDRPNTTNFTVSTTVPRLELRWPFNFVCVNVFQTVSARADGGNTTTPARIDIMRIATDTRSIFSNATTVSTTGFCPIATGTPVETSLTSAAVAPDANHVLWSAGDYIRFFQTSGANGSTTQSRNFHASKVYVQGYRR